MKMLLHLYYFSALIKELNGGILAKQCYNHLGTCAQKIEDCPAYRNGACKSNRLGTYYDAMPAISSPTMNMFYTRFRKLQLGYLCRRVLGISDLGMHYRLDARTYGRGNQIAAQFEILTSGGRLFIKPYEPNNPILTNIKKIPQPRVAIHEKRIFINDHEVDQELFLQLVG